MLYIQTEVKEESRIMEASTKAAFALQDTSVPILGSVKGSVLQGEFYVPFFFTTYKGIFSVSFNLGYFGNSLLPFISRRTKKLE